MRTHVDLFSGIGGFSLACEWAGVETIAFAEIDPYASRVLQRHWPNVRNYEDVREFPRLSAWLLTAGVPCQPASVAGKRKGAADDRWLWPETLAVVENGSYEWLLFENPTGILSLNDGLEFERICAALEGLGYAIQAIVIPAAAVGAIHRRDRVWIVGHAERSEWRTFPEGRNGTNRDNSRWKKATGGPPAPSANGGAWNLAHSDSAGLPQRETVGSRGRETVEPFTRQAIVGGSDVRNAASEGLPIWAGGTLGQPSPLTEFERPSGREVERDFRGVAHGVSARVDRLRCLGNAIVPQVAYQLIKRMIEAEG